MQVDFYVLKSPAGTERQRTACRLAEKAWQRGHRVFIHTDSVEAAKHIDDMLWSYRQDSFVPHAMLRDRLEVEESEREPVLVGDGAVEPSDIDVLINLAEAVPSFAARSTRVAEIVAGDDSSRRSGRTRYRHYRDQGVEIQQHDL